MKRNHNPPSSPRLIAQNDWDTTKTWGLFSHPKDTWAAFVICVVWEGERGDSL